MISFYNDSVQVKLPVGFKTNCKRWITNSIFSEKSKVGTINIILTSDELLLETNINYLHHDYYTDIITFDYSDNDLLSGDLFISIDRVTDNAKFYNVSFIDELKRVIIHGVLHLLGYNDITDEEKIVMKQKENIYLSRY